MLLMNIRFVFNCHIQFPTKYKPGGMMMKSFSSNSDHSEIYRPLRLYEWHFVYLYHESLYTALFNGWFVEWLL